MEHAASIVQYIFPAGDAGAGGTVDPEPQRIFVDLFFFLNADGLYSSRQHLKHLEMSHVNSLHGPNEYVPRLFEVGAYYHPDLCLAAKMLFSGQLLTDHVKFQQHKLLGGIYPVEFLINPRFRSTLKVGNQYHCRDLMRGNLPLSQKLH